MRKFSFVFLVFLAVACQTGTIEKPYDWQGHRGARGEAPENTLPAMLRALQEGVHTLEMDVVISADRKVLLSHEPYINPNICLDASQKALADSPLVNLFELTYDEISAFDCGSKPNPNFPSQENYFAMKPLLIDVISEVEEASLMMSRESPNYNIEIKTRPEWDSVFHPPYQEFVDLVLETLDKANLGKRLTLQSFDVRSLKYLHEKRPDIQLSYLVVEGDMDLKAQLERLGFIPDIYSPHYKMVDRKLITDLAALKIKLVPWTVNEIEDAKRLKEMGVDGIITDYPARLISTLGK